MMACGIQKLFSVEAEFEDEDFVLAMEDVEKQIPDPIPTSSRCSAALRSPSNTVEALSPVLPIQNYSRLRCLQDCSASESKTNQVASPSVAAFKVQEDQTALSAQSRPSPSTTRFKFVKRNQPMPSTHGDFDNELFLAACMDLEKSATSPGSGPSTSGCERMQDHVVSDAAMAKKMRGTESVMLSNTVGVETSQLKRTLKESSVGVSGHLQPAEASPGLVLRPTAVGSCPSQSNPGMGIISSPGCQLPKSLDQPVAGSYNSCLTLVRSSSPSGIALPRPQLSGQSSVTPERANRGAQLLTAYGSSTGSAESSPAMPRTPTSSGSLQMPVVTNHLVRLVTAAKNPPQPFTPIPEWAKTRRFPGPAGILPHQPDGKNLEEIMVSAPQTPTHGALAKLRTKEMPASQLLVEEDSGRGAWIAMKTELGLDERDPSCFLRTYSVVMVLRKAALKQLPKNKVPKMAVMIKSLTWTNVDAGVIFKDSTGEMQGTIHRLLLEQREGEFKAGSVLLLKQVSVFSPSHRNHYLNVTPNNLVKVYPPGLSIRKPLQEIRERMETSLSQAVLGLQQDSPTGAPPAMAATDCGKGQSCKMSENRCQSPLASIKGSPLLEASRMGKSVPNASSPKADSDDLDQLLSELPDEFFSNSDAQSALRRFPAVSS
ncbi:homologous recombination OB-fold protein isoform X2 [Sphaerodactylus townsendi]|nr:homologous recombination OB-fold protein isoform X2 [Sphaerodactylus townsendi]